MVDIDVTPKKWMEDPLYFMREPFGEWEQFQGDEEGRTVYLLVLPDGNVFSAERGRFVEQYDPLKMAAIAKLFEPLEAGLGDDQPEGE